MKIMKTLKAVTALLIALVLACAPLAAIAEPADVNQAVVEIDGKPVIMQVTSMETKQYNAYKYRDAVDIVNDNRFSLYGLADTVVLASAQMDIITMQQLDPRSGKVLKYISLGMPGNWEAEGIYQSKDADRLYGTPTIYYADYQTGERFDSPYVSSFYSYNDFKVHIGTQKSSVALIIDEANSDYTMLKGRFKGEVFSKSGTKSVTFGISSFSIDKNLFAAEEEPLFPDVQEPLFPELPDQTPEQAPDQAPNQKPEQSPSIQFPSNPTGFAQYRSASCFACRGSGTCAVCSGRRRYYVSGYAGSSPGSYVDCRGCEATGICSFCDGTGVER